MKSRGPVVEAVSLRCSQGCGFRPSEVTGCCLWSQKRNCRLHKAGFPSGRRHAVWVGVLTLLESGVVIFNPPGQCSESYLTVPTPHPGTSAQTPGLTKLHVRSLLDGPWGPNLVDCGGWGGGGSVELLPFLSAGLVAAGTSILIPLGGRAGAPYPLRGH